MGTVTGVDALPQQIEVLGACVALLVASDVAVKPRVFFLLCSASLFAAVDGSDIGQIGLLVLVLIAASRDSGLTWTTGREFFGQVYRDAAAVNRRRRVAAATLRMVVGAWIVSTLLHGTIFELRTALLLAYMRVALEE